MTQKELSYVEDAIGHEDNIIKILYDTINKMEDENLISFLENHIQSHTQLKENLIELLEEKANE